MCTCVREAGKEPLFLGGRHNIRKSLLPRGYTYSNQDQIWCVKIAVYWYVFFGVHRGVRLLWHPVNGSSTGCATHAEFHTVCVPGASNEILPRGRDLGDGKLRCPGFPT